MALHEQLAFNNSKVQRLRRLLGRRSSRSDEQAFVVEGAVLIREAITAGWTIECEFVAGDTEAVSNGQCFALDTGVMERVASTERPQPNLAVVAMPETAGSLADVSFAVVLDRLSDPGNLGTILRSSEAAGVDAVVLTPGSVDPFNPKVVRASAGAIFHLPIIHATIGAVGDAGLRLIGSSSHLGDPHTEPIWDGRLALILGNEAMAWPTMRQSTPGCGSNTSGAPKASMSRWRPRSSPSRPRASVARPDQMRARRAAPDQPPGYTHVI